MIERRFVFRGRCYQRDFYREAWGKLVLRTRILGDVQVLIDGERFTFSAAHTSRDLPTSEVKLEMYWPGPPKSTIKSVTLLLDGDTQVIRILRPAAKNVPIWAHLQFVFIEPSPSYFQRENV